MLIEVLLVVDGQTVNKGRIDREFPPDIIMWRGIPYVRDDEVSLNTVVYRKATVDGLDWDGGDV